LPRRRVVEDESAWKRHTFACRLLQLIAQLDRAERVNASFHQWGIRIDRAARGTTHHIKYCFE
tara:strand:- start:216 stop:404 length:189 start_codon:yes stop_codon:yes gene_type:complete